MTQAIDTPVWLLPGWQNSGPDHWQTWWEQQLGAWRLVQHDWEQPLRGDWIMRLQEALLARARPVVLVAHSLGCHLVAAWAAKSEQTHLVRAALLVAPPDPGQNNWPAVLHSWRTPVLSHLPFPAQVLASSNDSYCATGRAREMAAQWGAGFTCAGPLGHINAETGLKSFALARTTLLKLKQTNHEERETAW